MREGHLSLLISRSFGRLSIAEGPTESVAWDARTVRGRVPYPNDLAAAAARAGGHRVRPRGHGAPRQILEAAGLEPRLMELATLKIAHLGEGVADDLVDAGGSVRCSPLAEGKAEFSA